MLEGMLEQVRRAVKELEDTEKLIDVEGEANVEKIQAILMTKCTNC